MSRLDRPPTLTRSVLQDARARYDPTGPRTPDPGPDREAQRRVLGPEHPDTPLVARNLAVARREHERSVE